MLTWCLIGWFNGGKPSAVDAAAGALAGLVGLAGLVRITPAACFIAIQIKSAIKSDDSLDTFMVHGVGGTVEALLTEISAANVLVPRILFPTPPKSSPNADISDCSSPSSRPGFSSIDSLASRQRSFSTSSKTPMGCTLMRMMTN